MPPLTIDPTSMHGWEAIDGEGHVGITSFKAGSYKGRSGVILWHRNSDGTWCGGTVSFAERGMTTAKAYWRVESDEPLTISPSVLCACGFHGWIREGRWESA